MIVQQRGCLESLSALCFSLALFGFALILLLGIALLFLLAYAFYRLLRFVSQRYVAPQFYPATAVFAEQRLFGAPPDSQLFSAFDYWLWCLEQATGLTFTQTPGQLLAGSVIVSLVPALAASLVIPYAWPVLVVTAILFGCFTGYRLGQPAGGWFGSLGSASAPVSREERGGLSLGDEEW